MGCCESKSTNDVHGGRSFANSGFKDEPMTNAEIESRIECSERTEMLILGGMKMRFAYLSQRGYYPDGTKILQSKCCAFVLFRE
jgi:hypothetical protein